MEVAVNASNNTGASNNGSSASTCNCVIFRIDDIADYDDAEISLSLMELFLSKNQSLNLALVMSNLGSNQALVNKLAEGHKRGLFELTAHTWGPGPFNGTGLDDQKKRMSLIIQKMQYIFGRSTNVFVPPYGPYDNDTLEAMKELGLKAISSPSAVNKFPTYVANGSDIKDSYGIYHVPTTAQFVDYSKSPGRKVPISEVLESIDKSIAKYGWAVVVVHPQDFKDVSSDGQPTKQINNSALDDLSTIIDDVISDGKKITTFSKMLQIELPPIADNIPPVVEAPKDIVSVIPADSAGPQQISLGTPSVTDLVDPSPVVTNDAPTGGFPIGTTVVTWTAKDSSGHVTTAKQYVTVSYTRDERPPQITFISPAKDQQFKGADTDKAVTVNVKGIALDKDSGIRSIELRTVFGKKFNPFIPATPVKQPPSSPSHLPPDWSEWNANITFSMPGRFEIIAKATDYFGNHKVIVLPVTIDFRGSNLTETSLIIDPPSSFVLNENITITGRLVSKNGTNGSEVGIPNQVITFEASKPLFPDVVTTTDGRFSSSAKLPASSGLTFTDLQIQAYFPGDGSKYRPSGSEVTVKYRCGSLIQLTLCTLQ